MTEDIGEVTSRMETECLVMEIIATPCVVIVSESVNPTLDC